MLEANSVLISQREPPDDGIQVILSLMTPPALNDSTTVSNDNGYQGYIDSIQDGNVKED